MNRFAVDPSANLARASELAALADSVAAGRIPASVCISALPVGPGTLAAQLEPPVVPVVLGVAEALVGPLVGTGPEGGCPQCLDYWLRVNWFDWGRPRRPQAGLVDLVREFLESGALGGALGQFAVAIRIGDDCRARHAVYRRHDCSGCSGAPVGAALRLHCSRWVGIVSSVEASAEPSAGAYRATGRWAAPLPAGAARPLLGRQRSFGRGAKRADAESACIAEALERYSLIYRGDERMVRATLRDAGGVHPNSMQLFSEEQYRTRSAWNVAADDCYQVPEPFDEDLPIDWLEARPLRDGREPRLVPAACCLMWYQFAEGEPAFASADSVGCASGRTFDDALLGALLEAIERDAVAIWWDNEVRRPAIALETFASPDLDAAARGLDRIGRDLFLLDVTTDIGVPTYVAVAPRRDGTEPLVASAADLKPLRAAIRACTEVGQVWHDVIRTGALAPLLADWLLRESTSARPFLVPSRLEHAPGTTKELGWRDVVDRLAAVGLEAFAVDHSRPDVSLRTVRAVVPGLRHVWNRRGPGRLYEVPVKLGWTSAAKREGELNPWRCML